MDRDTLLLDEKQLAEYLGISVHALRRWRFESRGPRFFRLEGRLVRYRQEDVEGWMAAQRISGAA
jgi:excisionase family DNA binding protein